AVHVDVPGEAVDDVPVPVVHPGLAAADQPDAGIEPPERRGPPPDLGHVFGRGKPAVHLVAQAPVPDAERLGVPVRAPPACPWAGRSARRYEPQALLPDYRLLPSTPRLNGKGEPMRAAGVDRFGAEIWLLELPEPPVPRPGEVLIEVRACGVGNWDEFIRTGGWDTGARPPMPLGVEAAGVIAAIGDGVLGLRPGDAVTTHSL